MGWPTLALFHIAALSNRTQWKTNKSLVRPRSKNGNWKNAELRLRAQSRVFGGQIRKILSERLIWGVLTLGFVANLTESANVPEGPHLFG